MNPKGRSKKKKRKVEHPFHYCIYSIGKENNFFVVLFIQAPFGLFLFHWNKVCTSENPQKSEKKSERAPWPCSSGTFHWNNFFLPKSYFLQFGSAVLLLSFQLNNKSYLLLQTRNIEIFVPVECSSGTKSPNRH